MLSAFRMISTLAVAASALAVNREGHVLCFYERGALGADHYRTAFLTLARFNLEWLKAGSERPAAAVK